MDVASTWMGVGASTRGHWAVRERFAASPSVCKFSARLRLARPCVDGAQHVSHSLLVALFRASWDSEAKWLVTWLWPHLAQV